MDRARFERLMDVVGEAMVRAPDARHAYLVTACGDDDALLLEARSLVEEASLTSVGDVTGRLESMIGRAAGQASDDAALAVTAEPSRIGPYDVIETLGRGGMGVVYRARQHEPIRRDVAIKVVRRALGDTDVLARFTAERQALALMNHPGIARIFDAGTTEEGLPYFVMELVEGLPVTEYCEEHRLPLDERLDLFRLACEAVHHAHQRGVIHRDLKPSNILIGTTDGTPTPKVIDFGIAKATEALLYDESFQTRAGSFLGTVDYMSPEQLRGAPDGIDVRADVYALGVILYQLVTGRHPFSSTTLRSGGLVEAQRIILESEPPRPSSTIETGTRKGQARDRASASPGYRRRVRRDLDWVVMKALEKDRERRYSSASELARELERYARDEPVSAGPPSLVYRTAKFVRRHRVGVTAAALVALALTSGAVLAGVGFVRATADAARAQAIGDFLTDMLASVRPDEQGRAVTVREILDEAHERLEAGEFSNDPETEASLALVIGHSYEGLGEYGPARDLIRRSAELRRELYGPDDERLHASLYRLGTVLWKRGGLEEALELRLDLAEMTERLYGPSHPSHAESLSNLGNTYADMGSLERSAEYLTQAVDVGRLLPGPGGELDLARFLNNLGTVYFDLEDFESATKVFREALEIRSRLLGEETDVYAITLVNLGNAQLNRGDLTSAERTHRRAVELGEQIFGPDHPRTAYAYSGLAEVLHRQGRSESAEAPARRALAIRLATESDSYRPIAGEQHKLAGILIGMQRYEEARTELEAAWDGLVAAEEAGTLTARDVAATLAGLEELVGDGDRAALWASRAREG